MGYKCVCVSVCVRVRVWRERERVGGRGHAEYSVFGQTSVACREQIRVILKHGLEGASERVLEGELDGTLGCRLANGLEAMSESRYKNNTKNKNQEGKETR